MGFLLLPSFIDLGCLAVYPLLGSLLEEKCRIFFFFPLTAVNPLWGGGGGRNSLCFLCRNKVIKHIIASFVFQLWFSF